MTTSTTTASAAEEWNVVRGERRRWSEKGRETERAEEEKCNEYWRNENILLGNLHNDSVCSAGCWSLLWNAMCIMAHILHSPHLSSHKNLLFNKQQSYFVWKYIVNIDFMQVDMKKHLCQLNCNIRALSWLRWKLGIASCTVQEINKLMETICAISHNCCRWHFPANFDTQHYIILHQVLRNFLQFYKRNWIFLLLPSFNLQNKLSPTPHLHFPEDRRENLDLICLVQHIALKMYFKFIYVFHLSAAVHPPALLVSRDPKQNKGSVFETDTRREKNANNIGKRLHCWHFWNSNFSLVNSFLGF